MAITAVVEDEGVTREVATRAEPDPRGGRREGAGRPRKPRPRRSHDDRRRGHRDTDGPPSRRPPERATPDDPVTPYAVDFVVPPSETTVGLRTAEPTLAAVPLVGGTITLQRHLDRDDPTFFGFQVTIRLTAPDSATLAALGDYLPADIASSR